MAAVATADGQYTAEPVRTQYGYHLIKLEAIQPGKSLTFEEARQELEPILRVAAVILIAGLIGVMAHGFHWL